MTLPSSTSSLAGRPSGRPTASSQDGTPGRTPPRLIAACAILLLATPARADPVFSTTHGIQFSTISDPGNPVVPQSVGPTLYLGSPPTLIGAVDYEFRMARTEVTVEQWAEFITAYRPHYTGGNTTVLPFTGRWIQWSASQQKYVYDPANAQVATDPSWRVAAAYANWHHNGMVNESWAFQSGAYDVSTFTTNPDGTINDQPTHSPGARFWLPTLDEWTKAMYWDPDRYGQGQGGYWKYPTSSDEPPITGVPGVGQTNSNLPATQLSSYFPVGSYPDVQSPWGLWDGSGSEREWTEELTIGRWRVEKGSQPGQGPEPADWIDYMTAFSPTGSGTGFRIAAIVPAPPLGAVGVYIAVCAGVRRRRP